MLQLQINNLIERKLDKMIADPDSSLADHFNNLDIECAAFIAEYNVQIHLLHGIAKYPPDHELYDPSITELIIRECISYYDFESYVRKRKEEV